MFLLGFRIVVFFFSYCIKVVFFLFGVRIEVDFRELWWGWDILVYFGLLYFITNIRRLFFEG